MTNENVKKDENRDIVFEINETEFEKIFKNIVDIRRVIESVEKNENNTLYSTSAALGQIDLISEECKYYAATIRNRYLVK